MPSSRRSAPVRPVIREFQLSLEALTSAGDLAHTCLTLERGLEAGPTTATQTEWLGLLERFSAQDRARHAQAAWLSVRLYANTRQPERLLEFVVQASTRLPAADLAPLTAFQGFALTNTGRHEEALEALQEVLPSLTGLAAGLGWRAQGQALCWSQRPGWQDAFVRARSFLPRSLLKGRPLGLCWAEEGNLLERQGHDAQARDAWREALLLLKDDRYYAAWLRHSLGSSCLRFALPEAEDHFLTLERAVRHPEAAGFRAWAACGLGAARRARGEWARATTSYRQAIRLAQEDIDRRQAWRGLGYTQRLMGKPDLALEALYTAARCTPNDLDTGESWVYADIAACYAQLGRLPEAQAALRRTGSLTTEDAERVMIVSAELARQQGDEAQARALLAPLRPETLWAREERECFRALFDLLAPAQRPVPLTHSPGTVVEVQALGPLVVRVNGRPVPMPPGGRAAELLTLLLEHGNRAATEVVLEALYPLGDGSPAQGRRNRQALWVLVQGLRQALGWEASVQARGGAYQLDPAAGWWYDVREALARDEATPDFLSGNYHPWALSRAEQLNQRE